MSPMYAVASRISRLKADSIPFAILKATPKVPLINTLTISRTANKPLNVLVIFLAVSPLTLRLSVNECIDSKSLYNLSDRSVMI